MNPLSLVPQSLLVRAGSYLAVALVAFAAGNSYATRKFISEIQARRDAELAQVSAGLLEQRKSDIARIAADQARAEMASSEVFETVTSARDEAMEARNAALVQLEREKRTSKEMADAYVSMLDQVRPSPSPCGWSADARRVLDDAAGASGGDLGPGAGTTAPGSTGGAAAASLTPTPSTGWLSCDDLYRGYAALGEHDRNARARVVAWQQWYRTRIAGGTPTTPPIR